MLQETRVTSPKTHETYRLERRLGNGVIADVWLGVEVQEGGFDVAVKVARPGLSAEHIEQFKAEQATLARILGEGHDWPAGAERPPVPLEYGLGKLEPGGEAAVLLEYIDAPTLSSQTSALDLRLAQDALLEPAWQYAWLLNHLHNEVHLCQSDRKLGDLRWDAANKRLIVLDWNVVAEGIDRAPEDVRKFGEMWYVLLLGKTPTLALNVHTSPDWDMLDAAWRLLLERCLHPNRDARPSAAQLLDELTKRRDAYGLSVTDLAGQGQQELDQTQGPPVDYERVERAWWMLDLAGRRGDAAAQQKAETARKRLDGRGQQALLDVKTALEMFNTRQAESALHQAGLALAKHPDGSLQVARWRCLVDAVKAATDPSLSNALRGTLGAGGGLLAITLIPAVEALNAGQWAQVGDGLVKAVERLPEGQTKGLLGSLSGEVALYQAMQVADEARGKGQFDQAAQEYRRTKSLLGAIIYCAQLDSLVLQLTELQAHCERLDQERIELQSIKKQLSGLIDRQDFAQALTIWAQGIALTEHDLSTRHELLKDDFAPLKELAALDKEWQSNSIDHISMIKRLQDLNDRFEKNSIVQQYAHHISFELVSEFTRSATTVVYGIEIEEQLNLGIQIQAFLTNASWAQDMHQQREQIQQAIEILQAKEKKQRELIVLYVQTTCNADKLEILSQAAQSGIELFDDRKFSVSRLTRALLLEREKENLGFLFQHLDDLLSKVQQYEQELDAALGRLETRYQTGQQMLQDINNSNTFHMIGEIESVIQYQQYNDNLLNAHQTWMTLLAKKKPEELDQAVDTFDATWRDQWGNLNINSVLLMRHEDFTRAWYGRISQARMLERLLGVVEQTLSLRSASRQLFLQLLTRMEIALETMPDEVFRPYAQRWLDSYKQILRQVLPNDRILITIQSTVEEKIDRRKRE